MYLTPRETVCLLSESDQENYDLRFHSQKKNLEAPALESRPVVFGCTALPLPLTQSSLFTKQTDGKDSGHLAWWYLWGKISIGDFKTCLLPYFSWNVKFSLSLTFTRQIPIECLPCWRFAESFRLNQSCFVQSRSLVMGRQSYWPDIHANHQRVTEVCKNTIWAENSEAKFFHTGGEPLAAS